MHQKLLDEFYSAGKEIFKQIPFDSIDQTAKTFASVPKIYIIGVGHSGMIARILSMKLNHVGLRAYTVYDEINPPIDKNDLVIGVSQSGETTTVVSIAEKGKKLGAKVFAVTSKADSTLGTLADKSLIIPNIKPDRSLSVLSILGKPENQNVRGSIFGYNLYILFYAVIMRIAEIREESPESIDARHANLE